MSGEIKEQVKPKLTLLADFCCTMQMQPNSIQNAMEVQYSVI